MISKIKLQKLLFRSLPLLCSGLFALTMSLAQISAEAAKPKEEEASIFQSWQWSGSGQEESIELNTNGYRNIVQGAGMPEEGVLTEKPIAKIEPGPTAKEGLVIVGPDPAMGQLFEAIHWYELKDGSVKLYLSGQQFETLEAALQSKGEAQAARPFTKAPATETAH